MQEIITTKPPAKILYDSILTELDGLTNKEAIDFVDNCFKSHPDSNKLLEGLALELQLDNTYRVAEYPTDKLGILNNHQNILNLFQKLINLGLIPEDIKNFEFTALIAINDYLESKKVENEKLRYCKVIAVAIVKKTFKTKLIELVQEDICMIYRDHYLEGLKKLCEEKSQDSGIEAFSAPELYSLNCFEICNSSIVAHSLFSALTARTEKVYYTSSHIYIDKQFSNGLISISINNTPLNNEVFSDNFEAECAFAVASILVSAGMKAKDFTKPYKITGKRILELLGELYRKDTKGKRIHNIFTLDWLARIIVFLDGSKLSGEITPNVKGIKPFKFSTLPLLLFHEVQFEGDKDSYRTLKNITDLVIKYQIGGWLKYFFGKEYYYQFGYMHRKGIAVTGGMKSRLYQLLSITLAQTPKGVFRIETILRESGIEFNQIDRHKMLRMFNEFQAIIGEMKSDPDDYLPLYISPPEWLEHPKCKKPKGWFKQWLWLTVEFKLPWNYPMKAPIDIKPEKVSPVNHNLTLEGVLKAIEDSNVSKRKICTYLVKCPNYITKLTSRAALIPQKELKDIMDAINFLTKTGF